MFLTALSMKLKVNSEEFLMKREEFLEFVLVEFLLLGIPYNFSGESEKFLTVI